MTCVQYRVPGEGSDAEIWVEGLPCCACGDTPCNAFYPGRTNQKHPVPLCDGCMSYGESMGWTRLEYRRGVRLERVAHRLWGGTNLTFSSECECLGGFCFRDACPFGADADDGREWYERNDLIGVEEFVENGQPKPGWQFLTRATAVRKEKCADKTPTKPYRTVNVRWNENPDVAIGDVVEWEHHLGGGSVGLVVGEIPPGIDPFERLPYVTHHIKHCYHRYSRAAVPIWTFFVLQPRKWVEETGRPTLSRPRYRLHKSTTTPEELDFSCATVHDDHRPNKKLDCATVIKIREMYADRRERIWTHKQLAKEFGVSSATVAAIVTGATWKDAGGPIQAVRPRRGSWAVEWAS